jgi:hypothetical protein
VHEHALAAPPRSVPKERATRWTAPWTVAAVVALVYAALIVPRLGAVNNFAHIGHQFLTQSKTSSVIKPSLGSQSKIGFDGQFYYFIALDPEHARDYVDGPSYRYSRIGYPMLARALSGGNSEAIPYLMIFINVAAIVAGTLAVAIWLKRRGTSPWFALLYGFFPGLIFSVFRDLTEPLGFALAAWGMVVFDRRSWRRLLASAGLFAYALLTRETVALFPAILFLSLVVDGLAISNWTSRTRENVLRAAAFGALAFGPMLAWRYSLNFWMTGASGVSGDSSDGARKDFIPLHGIIEQWPLSKPEFLVLLAVVVPGVVTALIALRVLLSKRNAEVWLLALSVAVFVIFVPSSMDVDYGGAGRAAIGVVLAALIALPHCEEVFGKDSRAIGWSLVLWSLPAYILASVVLAGPGPALLQ